MTDDELRAWSGSWQSRVPELAPLRDQSARQSRRFALLVAADVLVCAAGLLVAAWLLLSGDALYAACGGALVVVCVAGLAFTARNWRGVWAAGGESARQFLELALARKRALVRWILFGVWLLVAEVAFFVALIAWQWRTGAPGGRIAATAGLLAVFTLLAGFALGWFLRRTRRQRDALGRLAAELGAVED